MPFPAQLLVIATMLPLTACLIILCAGRRLGTTLAGYVAIAFIAISLLCSGWAMMRWIGGGNYLGVRYGNERSPINITWKWIGIEPSPSGPAHGIHARAFDAAIYIDSLTIGLFVTVTMCAMLVHIFAARSLRRDPRTLRLLVFLPLGCAATLATILSGTLLQQVVFLELAGFCAAMLISLRSERPGARRASASLLIIQRVGDVGLILGLGALLVTVGTLWFPDLWLLLGGAAHGGAIILPGGEVLSTGLLTAVGIALFIGAAARCAQFPLHVWAGLCADGVAPAITSVFTLTVSVGGVCMLCRVFPILTPSARLFVAMVGAISLVMAALLATVQSDSKKLLIYVGVAQLGYMALALGVGSWVGASFHLIAYMLFQTLLFLAAGAVIRGARGQTQLEQYGGLARKMPVTATMSLIAVLAICGVGWGEFGLSGYHSRQIILTNCAAFVSMAQETGRSGAYRLLFFAAVAGAVLVAFASARWWLLTFAGGPRDLRLFDHARDISSLFWPMVILAVLTILGGRWLGVREIMAGAITEGRHVASEQAKVWEIDRQQHVLTFDAAWKTEGEDELGQPIASASSAVSRGGHLAAQWSLLAWATGICAAVVSFLAEGIGGRLSALPPLSWIIYWLRNDMFFEDLYESIFVSTVMGAAQVVAWVDRQLMIGIPGRLMRLVRSLGSLRHRSSQRWDMDLPPVPPTAYGSRRPRAG